MFHSPHIDMKTLQKSLFLIATVLLVAQSARNIHHLIFGMEPSVMDQFQVDAAMKAARAEPKMETLLSEYKPASDEVKALEKGKTYDELRDIRTQHEELYKKYDALSSEITQRESQSRELRDHWLYSGFGFCLIVIGGLMYRREIMWPGFSLVVAGFCVLEWWASPSFSNLGGAAIEYHRLLVSKMLITLGTLATLFVAWSLRGTDRAQAQQE
jgi:hypothetical protein